jgi:hypothetical protein
VASRIEASADVVAQFERIVDLGAKRCTEGHVLGGVDFSNHRSRRRLEGGSQCWMPLDEALECPGKSIDVH